MTGFPVTAKTILYFQALTSGSKESFHCLTALRRTLVYVLRLTSVHSV